MCAVSYMGDYWKDQLPKKHPWVQPYTEPYINPGLPPMGGTGITLNPPGVTQEQFDELKKEMQELKKLVLAAIEYDKKTGEPDCHMDEKVALIKRLAELVGVDMSEVFKK